MRIIDAGSSKIRQILGKQTIRSYGISYRLMRFVLQTDCCAGVVLHNVITGQLVLLNDKETEAIASDQVTACDDLNELIESYFLVPLGYDEKALVDKLRDIIVRVFSPKGLSLFTILTTTNCNARCFYCYEKGLSRIDMDQETADRVVEYISEHKSPGMITLNWFGGEPLVCAERIDQISAQLARKGFEFSSTMTSNGYLFNPQMINRAVELWRLKHTQITLDGRKEVYNRVKSYVVNDCNPYDCVLNNIESLLKAGVHVSIRLNFDRFNLEDVRALADELKERFDGYDNLSVYDHYILSKPGFNSFLRSKQDEEQLLREQYSLLDDLIRLGLKKQESVLPRLRTRSCGADKNDSIVIYPDGRLYECIEIVEDEKVGDIWSSHLDTSVVQLYQERYELSECCDCPLYPYCILLAKCPDDSKRNGIHCEKKIQQNLAIIRNKASQLLSSSISG